MFKRSASRQRVFLVGLRFTCTPSYITTRSSVTSKRRREKEASDLSTRTRERTEKKKKKKREHMTTGQSTLNVLR